MTLLPPSKPQNSHSTYIPLMTEHLACQPTCNKNRGPPAYKKSRGGQWVPTPVRVVFTCSHTSDTVQTVFQHDTHFSVLMKYLSAFLLHKLFSTIWVEIYTTCGSRWIGITPNPKTPTTTEKCSSVGHDNQTQESSTILLHVGHKHYQCSNQWNCTYPQRNDHPICWSFSQHQTLVQYWWHSSPPISKWASLHTHPLPILNPLSFIYSKCSTHRQTLPSLHILLPPHESWLMNYVVATCVGTFQSPL